MSTYSVLWINTDGVERRVSGLTNAEAHEVYARLMNSPAVEVYIQRDEEQTP